MRLVNLLIIKNKPDEGCKAPEIVKKTMRVI